MLNTIILAGGLGTRLAPRVPNLPKALAPIQGTPFLHLIFRQLEKTQLISKVVLALGHKATAIQEAFSHTTYPFPIEFSIESAPLGTGGAILHALAQTEGETLLIMNGDTYLDFSLSALLHFHQTKKADVTLICRNVPDISRYGALKIAPSSRILSFQEKSSSPESGWINAGIYCMQRSLLQSLPPGPSSLEKDIFPLLLQKNLFAFPSDGTFIDIGTPDSYNESQEILKPWALP